MISRDTLIPLGGALALCTAMIGGHAYLAGQFNAIHEQVLSIDRRLERLEDAVERSSADRWRASDMKLWAIRLAHQNPDLDVPEPGEER